MAESHEVAATLGSGDANANETSAWAAPYADAPVSGHVNVPGSKSMTNRALVLASISDGPSRISGALIARDTELMIRALRQLGAKVTTDGSTIDVVPLVRGTDVGNVDIDCGLAGTVMRFLPAIAGLVTGHVRFDGDDAARSRPMGELIGALSGLGVIIDAPTGGLPLTIKATGTIAGGEIDLDASASSQFISALLLAAPTYDQGVTVTNTSVRVPSAPYIDMTMSMLAERGVVVTADGPNRGNENLGHTRWVVQPSAITALDCIIEPDLSNALPFIAAAAVTGGDVSVDNWPADSTQPGQRIQPILRDMGCKITWERTSASAGTLHVSGPARLRAIDVDMADLGELAPTLAAICLFADGTSRLRNLSHIRGHETDRLAALETIGTMLTAAMTVVGDDLVISGLDQVNHEDSITTTLPSFDDHRLATAGAIIGLRRKGILVENIATTSKTLPDFPRMWSELVQ